MRWISIDLGTASNLDVVDARLAYEAIRLAAAGALGEVGEQDVRHEPTQTLRQVMSLAADRDLVARQYANGFHEILADGVPALRHGLQRTGSIEDAIIHCHLHLMANHPDSLIARKCGPDLARDQEQSGRRNANQQRWFDGRPEPPVRHPGRADGLRHARPAHRRHERLGAG